MRSGIDREALRRVVPITILAAIMGIACALAIGALKAPLYTSTISLSVGSGTDTEPLAPGAIWPAVEVLEGEEVASRLADLLSMPRSSVTLKDGISVAVVSDHPVTFDVSVTDPSARRAQRVAEAIGEILPDLGEDPNTSAGGLIIPYLGVAEGPSHARMTDSRAGARLVFLGLVSGAVVGVAVSARHTRKRD